MPRAMAWLAATIKPALARQARAALAMDTIDGRSALRGAWSRANLVVQVDRVIEVVPGEAGEAGFPAHLLG